MNFFISDAMAQGGAPAQDGGLMAFLPMILIFAIFYFLLIRPQQKKAKEHKAMTEALSKGDEIVTSGGVLGRVTETTDTFVKVEISDGTEVWLQRHAIGAVMPKGTIKELK